MKTQWCPAPLILLWPKCSLLCLFGCRSAIRKSLTTGEFLLLNVHGGESVYYRDGDEWEKWDIRVKPQNRRQPGRPRPPWTATRTTKCYGSVCPALRSNHRTTQLLSQLLCRTESQRQCPWLRRWETTEAKEVQLSLSLSSPAPPPCS